MAVPKIPLTQIQSSGDSARGGASLSPVSAAEASNRRAGISAFSGLMKLGEAIKDVWHQNNLERDRIRSVEVEAKYMADSDDKLAKLDPLTSDYADRVKSIYEDGRKAAFEGADLRTPEAKSELDARLARLAGAGQLTAAGVRRGSLEKEAVRVWDNEANSTLAAIRKDPDAYDTWLASFKDASGRLNQGIRPDMIRAKAESFADAAIAAKVEGLAEKGRYGDARKTLDAEKTISQDLNRTLVGRIKAWEATHRADGERGRAGWAADRAAEIEAGGKIDPKTGATIPGTQPPDLTTIAQDRAAGRITPEASRALRHMILTGDARRIEATRKDEDAVARFQSRTVENQEQADRAFSVLFEGRDPTKKKADPTQPLDGQQINHATQFAAQSGWVPTALGARVENAERAGGPGMDPTKAAALLAQAAMIADSVGSGAPYAKGMTIGPRVQAVVTAVKQDGLSWDDAAKQVIARTPTDDKMVEDRKKNWEVLSAGVKWTDEVASEFQRGFSAMLAQSLLPGVANPGAVQIPLELANEAKRLAQRNYELVGGNDIGRVRQMTIDQLKRDYGVSMVGGKPQVMRYPPESQLPPEVRPAVANLGGVPLATKIIEADVTKALEGKGIKPNPPANGLPGHRLMPDSQTEAERRSGIQPSYRLQLLNADGYSYTDVMRYRVPTAAEVRASEPYRTAEGLQRKKQGIEQREADEFMRQPAPNPARPLGMPPQKPREKR